MRQKDKLFIDLLNKVRVGNIDDDVEKFQITVDAHWQQFKLLRIKNKEMQVV